jgi:hypothetical protein
MLHTDDLAIKGIAAYEHGRRDFRADAPRDPKTPLRVYRDLDEEQQAYIMRAWDDGWMNECLMQSLPDGMPA